MKVHLRKFPPLDVAFYFISKWYEITKSDDIGELLSMMQGLEDGEPADPAMWDYAYG